MDHPAAKPSPSRALRLAWMALVALAAFLAFAPAVRDAYVLDDVAQARDLKVPESIPGWARAVGDPWWPAEKKKSLWRPVTRLAILAEKSAASALGSDGPAPLHGASLLLHVAGCVLILPLAWRLGLGWLAGLAAALLLAVHPLRSESVHQIAGQAELLAALFMTAGLASYLRSTLQGASARCIAAEQALFYALALGSKEHAVIYPLFLALIEIVPRLPENGQVPPPLGARARCTVAASLALVLGLFLCGKYRATGALLESRGSIPFYENPLASMGFVKRLPAALGTLGYAVLNLVAPIGLSPDYSFDSLPFASGWAWPMAWSGAGFLLDLLIFMALFIVAGWHGHPVLPGRRGCALAAAGLASYLFTSNLFFPIGVGAAMRLWHFPMIAPALAAGWLWERWDEKRRASPSGLSANLPRLALFAFLVLLASRSWEFAPAWRDNQSFAERTLAIFPNSWRANRNLAQEFYGQRRFEESLHHARQAARILPDSPISQDDIGLAMMFIPGHEADAERAFLRAIELAPDFALPRKHLGNLLMMLGRASEAVPHFERYLATSPADAAETRAKIASIRAIPAAPPETPPAASSE